MTKRHFTIEEGSLPDLPAMMLATIEALKKLGGSATILELDQKVIELESVTEGEQNLTMPNKKQARVNYYLAWARTYLKRGGALTNSDRGVWALTPEGTAITSVKETLDIHKTVNLEERERYRNKRQPDAEKKDTANSQGDSLDESEDWKELLLNVLGSMKPDAFERLTQRLLREKGFTKVEVRGKSNDGGIDGVGVLSVELVSFQVYFQCKRWKGPIGAKEIRDFRGALQGRADKGLFITTSHFTSQALDEATREGAIAIDLIDGERLCDLLKDKGLGVEVEMIEKIDIQSDWYQKI